MPLSQANNRLYTRSSQLVGQNAAGLTISALNDLSEAIADADLLLIDNGGDGGTNVKFAASRIPTYVFSKVSLSIKVQTKTLSTLMKEQNIDLNNYDFLNIDVEGAELDILRGFEDDLKYINVIDMETSVNDRHLSGAPHQTIVEWLSERGFELKEMSSSYEREGWGDSVFVRNDRDLSPFVDGNAGNDVYGEGYLERLSPWGK